MGTRHGMVRGASGLAIGLWAGLGGASDAAAQAVTLEVVADQTVYAVFDPISLDVYVSWDDEAVGAPPGVMTALAEFSFRLECGAGIMPTGVTFHPDLAGNAGVDAMDGTGVEISGFQLPPFLMQPMTFENPVRVATVVCVSDGGPLFNEVGFELTTSPSVSVFNDDLGFSAYRGTIGQKSFAIIPEEVVVNGGPCCEEDPCSPADLAEPFGSYDFSDVAAFLGLFAGGCP